MPRCRQNQFKLRTRVQFSMEPNNSVRVPLPFFDRVQHQWFVLGFCWYALRNLHWGGAACNNVLLCDGCPGQSTSNNNLLRIRKMRSRSGSGSIREFPPVFRLTNLLKLNFMNGSMKELPICTLSTSLQGGVALPSAAVGYRDTDRCYRSAFLETRRSLRTKIDYSSILR